MTKENCPYLEIGVNEITVFNCPSDKAYLVTDDIDTDTRRVGNWDILTEDNTVSTNGSYRIDETIYCYVFDNNEIIIEDINYAINNGYSSIGELMEYYGDISYYLGTFDNSSLDDIVLFDIINCQGSGNDDEKEFHHLIINNKTVSEITNNSNNNKIIDSISMNGNIIYQRNEDNV